jgi:hypothetical protein
MNEVINRKVKRKIKLKSFLHLGIILCEDNIKEI